ncbi:hypothetical protein B0A49_00130 [Cryomyces minteri]|uniref:Uncharacterized protein n=1 Tax=Cryomyces minteri TaxID=331657 RepID=A0A4U0Y295_9PEZI|nr:hypothetical protein B0A49_00130 [Cryomyces minteri]
MVGHKPSDILATVAEFGSSKPSIFLPPNAVDSSTVLCEIVYDEFAKGVTIDDVHFHRDDESCGPTISLKAWDRGQYIAQVYDEDFKIYAHFVPKTDVEEPRDAKIANTSTATALVPLTFTGRKRALVDASDTGNTPTKTKIAKKIAPQPKVGGKVTAQTKTDTLAPPATPARRAAPVTLSADRQRALSSAASNGTLKYVLVGQKNNAPKDAEETRFKNRELALIVAVDEATRKAHIQKVNYYNINGLHIGCCTAGVYPDSATYSSFHFREEFEAFKTDERGLQTLLLNRSQANEALQAADPPVLIPSIPVIATGAFDPAKHPQLGNSTLAATDAISIVFKITDAYNASPYRFGDEEIFVEADCDHAGLMSTILLAVRVKVSKAQDHRISKPLKAEMTKKMQVDFWLVPQDSDVLYKYDAPLTVREFLNKDQPEDASRYLYGQVVISKGGDDDKKAATTAEAAEPGETGEGAKTDTAHGEAANASTAETGAE